MKYTIYILLLLLLACKTNISNEQFKDSEERRENTEKAVSEWIKKYAKFPDSYEPLSFSDYEESYSSNDKGKIPNSENYKIRHSHKILTKDSVLETYTGYFILEYDYFVSAIENKKSNMIGGAFPPKTEIWTERYGRDLNSIDSLELKKREELQTQKVFNELKEALEKGDVQYDNLEDEELLKKIIDSTLK